MGINGGAAGMSDENRLGGSGNGVGGRAITAVAEIGGDALLIHFSESGDSGRREARILGIKAAAAEEAVIVVGELHDAHAKFAKEVDAAGICFEKGSVLEAGEDAEFVGAFRESDLGMLADDREIVREFFDEKLERAEGVKSFLEIGGGYGAVDGGDAGLANRGEKFRCGRGIQVDAGAAKGIDDDGVLVNFRDGR